MVKVKGKKATKKVADYVAQMAEISQAHLLKLSPAERDERIRAFKRVVASGSADTPSTDGEEHRTTAYRAHGRGRQ